MCLADRIKVTAPEADVAERVRLQKLAETVVLTSQGIPFIWCGDEMMRDKKGVHNSYNSPDSINVISWKLKTENQSLFQYMQTLIAMRKAHPAFRMGRADLVRKHLQFLPVKGKNLIAYRLADHAAGDEWRDIIVVLNSNMKAVRQEVPEGEWTIIAKDGAASLNGLGKIKGKTVKVPAQSALILKR
jgi:pullulanase